MSSEPTLYEVGNAELSTEQLTKKALYHALCRIHDDPHVGYFIGIGTETFDLLTEAYARFTTKEVKEIRESFNCPNAVNPAADQAEDVDFCSGDIADHMCGEDVLDYLSDISVPSRLELIDQIYTRFCRRCGGDQGAGLASECGCKIRRVS